MKILTFGIVLRRMSALTKMLMIVARLGGKVTYISAADCRITLVVLAPASAAHRFAPQLRRIVDVLELVELRSAEENSRRQTKTKGDTRAELGVA